VSLHLQIFPEFGRFCASGENAAAFRFTRIEPFLDSHDKIILDFAGVHNVNSSFANALVANLISQHFTNCNALVRVAIESAIALGLERLRDRKVAA
jgi:anti-anti-sigma regulatory factor